MTPRANRSVACAGILLVLGALLLASLMKDPPSVEVEDPSDDDSGDDDSGQFDHLERLPQSKAEGESE